MKIRPAILLLLSALIISGTAHAQRSELRIGWTGPLSGNSAVLGVDSAKAIRMVFEEANRNSAAKIEFKLVAEDDSLNTQKSVTAYRKLTGIDKVPAIIFVSYGGLFAVAEQAERDNVILVDPLDCNEAVAALPRNTLCVAAMTEGIGKLNAELAHAAGHKRAAILFFEDDPFMSTVAKSTEETLRALGGGAVFVSGYSGTQSDFKPLLLRAKELKSDSLYLYGHDEAAAAMKQARALGMQEQFYATATVLSPQVITAAGPALEGTKFSVFTPSDRTRYEAFIAKFTARYGAPPILDISTVPSFDLAEIIVNFAQNYNGDVTAPEFSAALRSHLYGLKDYPGASGTITVGEDGAVRSLILKSYSVKDGKRVN